MSSAHNVQGAAGRSSQPRRGGLAWVLTPSAGPTAGTERCSGEQMRLPPKGAPAPRTSQLGVAGTAQQHPPLLVQLPALRSGPGDGGSVHPVLSPLPSPGGRLKRSQFPSPLWPHSALLSLLWVWLKCSRGKQGKRGDRPLRCHLQSTRLGGDIPSPCRHLTRRDWKEHVLGRSLQLCSSGCDC